MAGILETREGKIERLQQIIRQLKRAQFGRRSERLDPDQLALEILRATSRGSARCATRQSYVIIVTAPKSPAPSVQL